MLRLQDSVLRTRRENPQIKVIRRRGDIPSSKTFIHTCSQFFCLISCLNTWFFKSIFWSHFYIFLFQTTAFPRDLFLKVTTTECFPVLRRTLSSLWISFFLINGKIPFISSLSCVNFTKYCFCLMPRLYMLLSEYFLS